MTPNFAPAFRYGDEVEILDETGHPTGRRGYVHARHCQQDNDTPEYAVMLAGPPGGSRHYPAALLRSVARPAEPRVQHVIQRKRKHRPKRDDGVTTSVVVLHGPPLPKQKASVATPRRHAPQVQPPEEGASHEQHSTDRPRMSIRRRS